MRQATLLLLLCPPLAAQVPAGDALRIQEAFRLVAAVQDSVWPGGLGNTPFPLLLVTGDREYLVSFPRTPDGFEPGGLSPGFTDPVLTRARQFPTNLLATFPAFGPPSVIVVGQPQATGKTSTEWILTILHERFHQFQYADPSYFAAVDTLGLSGGDQTGMWMLNYPFPYDSSELADQFASLARTLGRLVQTSTSTERKEFWRSYREFLDGLAEPDRRYFGFQVWQEGISRYVEIQGAAAAARLYQATPEFRALPDYEAFGPVADRLRATMLRELATADLSRNRRVNFYPFGAALAMLLDMDDPGWKDRYMEQKFSVGIASAAVPPRNDLGVRVP